MDPNVSFYVDFLFLFGPLQDQGPCEDSHGLVLMVPSPIYILGSLT